MSRAGRDRSLWIFWAPLLTFFLAVFIDFSMVYHEKATIAQLVHKTNRAVSGGAYGSADEAQAALTNELQTVASDASATVTKGDTEVKTSVTASVSRLPAAPPHDRFEPKATQPTGFYSIGNWRRYRKKSLDICAWCSGHLLLQASGIELREFFRPP